MAKITVIAPTRTAPGDRLYDNYDTNGIVDRNTGLKRRLKVAAYARVSTELDEQQSSYEAQIEYYTKKIKSHDDWEFAGIFADEGISGTSIKKRVAFQEMILRAMSGDIDIILTKSISRFGRNTVDVLETVRKLKEYGVEVLFEKESISSLDPTCEMILTFMSSIAQEESRSTSTNVRWAHKKRMEEGRVSMSFDHFLGYQKGPDGRPEIVEKEAKVVRLIYDLLLQNYTLRQIAEILEAKGYKSPAGKDKWHETTIRSILTNEKYAGKAILQKTYTVDFMDKVRKKNNGERPMYIVENSHDAIIDEATFNKVQEIMATRKQKRQRKRDNRPLANIIVCGDCGAYYKHKFWSKKKRKAEIIKELAENPDQTPDKYKRREVWVCSDRYKKDCICNSPILEEKDIIKAFNEMLKQANLKDKKYSESLWRKLVEKVIAKTSTTSSTLTFILKNGYQYTVPVKTKNIKENELT